MVKQPLKVLELFAGIGACSKALTNLGIEHEIVDAVEIDKFAIKSFNAIHGTNFEAQDITQWDKEVVADLIMHGSPCQDFSIAGKGAGGDEGSGTRSSLMYETLRIVEKIRPKYVIWENVPAVLSGKHHHNFFNYISRMKKIGYLSTYKKLNAKDYGVPQNRVRVFTVSIYIPDKTNEWNDLQHLEIFDFPSQEKKDAQIKKVLDLPKEIVKDNERQRRVYSINGISPTILNRTDSPKIAKFNFPETKPLTIRLADILEANVDEKYYLSDEQTAGFVYKVSNGGSGIVEAGKLHIKANQQIRRVYLDKGISPTLDTMQGGHRQPKIVVNKEPRKGDFLEIKTATKKGYDEATIGDCANLAYPESKTRRGRVGHSVAQTLATGDNIGAIDIPLRIRKLTPKECWRLMGFDDEDFEKAKNTGISNTQLYKQAGNSIVVNVLGAILDRLLKRRL